MIVIPISSKKSGSKHSLYKGVSFNIRQKKYVATISVNKKRLFLGYYSNEVDAVKAYNESAIKYYGEFANLNVIEDQA